MLGTDVPINPAHNLEIRFDIDPDRLYVGWYKLGLQAWDFSAAGFVRPNPQPRTAVLYHQAQSERNDNSLYGAWAVRMENITVGGTTHLYIFQSDRNYGMIVDCVGCVAGNKSPTADAGADQSVMTGDIVQLDGSGSSDPENDSLTYSWSLTVPDGSGATLSNAAIVNPTFVANADGVYVATLVVNDGTTDSGPDTITATASVPGAETITITKATYSSRKVELKVEASSTLGGEANTNLVATFFDGVESTPKAMTFNAGKGKWAVTFGAADGLTTNKPAKVKVSSANAFDETMAIGGK